MLASRGGAYARQGIYDKALADLDAAIRLDPKSAYAYLERAGCYYMQGRYDRALADTNQSLRLDPKNADASSVARRATTRSKTCAKALADLDEAIKLNPRHAVALARRADLLMAIRRAREGPDRPESLDPARPEEPRDCSSRGGDCTSPWAISTRRSRT